MQKSAKQNIKMLYNTQNKVPNYMIIILQLHLKVNIKQLMVEKSK